MKSNDDRDRTGERPENRPAGQRDPKDTDHVEERTEGPETRGDTKFDPEAPGNYVDDEQTSDIPEPNEPG